MGIYIKGMEMPKSSRRCPFTEMDDWGMRCIVGGKHEWHKDRLCNECPLVELPPHGDLIDRDALVKQLGITDMDCFKCAWGNQGFCGRSGDFNDACEAIDDAPTIIEAEGRE